MDALSTFHRVDAPPFPKVDPQGHRLRGLGEALLCTDGIGVPAMHSRPQPWQNDCVPGSTAKAVKEQGIGRLGSKHAKSQIQVVHSHYGFPCQATLSCRIRAENAAIKLQQPACGFVMEVTKSSCGRL